MTAPVTARSPRDSGELVIKRPTWLIAVVALVSLAVLIVPAVATTIAAGSAPYERLFVSFPGLEVGVATAIGQAIATGASAVTVGALVSMLVFRDARGRSAKELRNPVELPILQAASAIWATAAGAMVFLDMLDSSGMPFERITEPGAVAFLFEASSYPAAWTVSFVAALVALVSATFASRWTGLLVATWASGFGVLAPVVVGQILVGPNHDFGGDAGVIETLVTQGVLGVLVALAIRSATGRVVAPELVVRLLRTLLIALPVLIACDVLLAWFKLAGTGLFESTTGWQIIARWGWMLVLCVAVVLTWAAWRRGRLQERGVARLLAVSTVAVSGWMGITAAMTRVPPPHYFQPTSISQVFLGFEVQAAPSFEVLATHWRPNLLFIALAAVGVSVYLIAVAALRRRGDRWPVGRTTAWTLGWIVVVVATSSGFGKYSAPDFGIHMVVHMTLNMLAPILLAMGGVITLLLRAVPPNREGIAGLHEWITWLLHWRGLRVLYNPLVVFLLFISSYYGLYFTGIFGEFMRFHWAHQLMNVHFLIAGYLFYSLVVGVDRPPRPLPHIGKLGFVLAAMPFHAFFGVILMSMPTPVAETFYRYLDLPWADLQAAQYVGGGVAWAGGELPLLFVIIALSIQWARQDAREAKRKDRHFDSGLDDEFAAYNRMLARLTARQNGGAPAPHPEHETHPEHDQQPEHDSTQETKR